MVKHVTKPFQVDTFKIETAQVTRPLI